VTTSTQLALVSHPQPLYELPPEKFEAVTAELRDAIRALSQGTPVVQVLSTDRAPRLMAVARSASFTSLAAVTDAPTPTLGKLIHDQVYVEIDQFRALLNRYKTDGKYQYANTSAVERELDELIKFEEEWRVRMTLAPSGTPTVSPSLPPSAVPSVAPTESPTVRPTIAPTIEIIYRTDAPTLAPTSVPTLSPTFPPSITPTAEPSFVPSWRPTDRPTLLPSGVPTASPTVNNTPWTTNCSVVCSGKEKVLVNRTVEADFTIFLRMRSRDTGGSAYHWWAGRGLVDAELEGRGLDFGLALGEGRALFGAGGAGGGILSGRSRRKPRGWPRSECGFGHRRQG